MKIKNVQTNKLTEANITISIMHEDQKALHVGSRMLKGGIGCVTHEEKIAEEEKRAKEDDNS